MKKTFTDLKRALVPGAKLILVERFGKPENQERIIKKVQTNAIAFDKNGTLSWLPFPTASLVEFDGKRVTFYGQGLRELTEDEKRILDNQPSDPKQGEIDALSDGSTMFYRRQAYFRQQNSIHLTTYNKGKHLRYVRTEDGKDKPMIDDPTVRGKVELVYEFA
jgi:hypothetical protein